MPHPTAPGPNGLDLRPFRAVRYDPGHVGDLSAVICPPYDEAPPAHARAQRVRPHHLSRLLYADDPRTALGQLRRWLGRGVLRRDDAPALYVYEQRHDEHVVQRGLIGELRLAAPSPGPLLPHEAVRPHEVRRQAALMAGLRAHLEPLLVACRPADRTLPAALDGLVRRPPAAVARTGRVTHRLWACPDPALARCLADGPALIADGHHRIAATRQLMDGGGERPPGSSAAPSRSSWTPWRIRCAFPPSTACCRASTRPRPPRRRPTWPGCGGCPAGRGSRAPTRSCCAAVAGPGRSATLTRRPSARPWPGGPSPGATCRSRWPTTC
ncbi:DUF1015 domain-containing protein [Streptomyces sp. G45]|uniref:DUF1015 domain-containing protein n=1 Tax=Streptomyces sp. G45 TaxID=3406627 RepID=UPI003C249353